MECFNHDNNESTWTTSEFETSYRRAFLVIQFTQASVITLLNLAVIVTYRCMHYNRKTVSNYLLYVQGLSDTYIAFIMWFEIIAHYLQQHGYYNDDLALLYETMLEYSYTISLGNLFLCAIERYLSVNKPIFHRRNVTKIKVMFGSIVIGLVSTIPAVILLLLSSFSTCGSASPAVITYSFVFDSVMLLFIFASLAILAQTLINARSVIRPKETRNLNQLDSNKLQKLNSIKKKEYRLVKIFIAMILAYILTYLPVTVGRILFDTGSLKTLSQLEGVVMISLCHTLYKTSALFNPILTISLREDYRVVIAKWTKYRKKSKPVVNKNESKFELLNTDSMTTNNREYIYTTYV